MLPETLLRPAGVDPMAGAAAAHLRREETQMVRPNVVLLVLAVVAGGGSGPRSSGSWPPTITEP